MAIPWEKLFMKKKSIYKITNKINGKVYVGQAIHPQKR